MDVGGLPVSAKAPVGATDDFLSGARVHGGGVSSSLGRLKLTVADPKLAEAAGVRGVLLSASRVDSNPVGGGDIDLTVDYTGFAQLYGGDFGNRLRLVQLPACVLSTPENRKCQAQLELGSVNAGGKVSAQIALSDAAKPTPMPKAGVASAEEPPTLTEASGPAVFAVTAGANSDGATFEATSLSPTYSWAAGGQGGSFTWSYPLKVPDGLGGPAPELALSYDSGSVDGKTLAANGQASWVGEGWELQAGGFIERSYRSCEQDGATSSNVADFCWFSSHNATLMLGGKSFKLIRDNATGVWKTDDDNGWRVEQKFGGGIGNGDNDDEHWVVTTLDGTQYWFGKHKRYPADTQVTNSVQLVPVWGNHAGEPCATSWCMQGYRWNLDYVHDTSNNSMTYFYAKWRGFYGFNGNCCGALEYDIYAHLDHIDYGTRVGSESNSPAPMQVWFVKTDRCVGACAWPSDFVDTPGDLACSSATSCPNVKSPAFWTRYKLSNVYTQVRKADGTGYRKVNQWDLAHSYPSTGDIVSPAGDDTSPNLWLDSLTHTGYAPDGVTALAEPAITFGRTDQMTNRVDWGDQIAAPYVHYRVAQVDNGVGGRTIVAYSGNECLYGNFKPAPAFNPYRCFPQHYKPAQSPAGYAWFHKFVVLAVTEEDLTAAGSPAQTVSYTYNMDASTDSSLWGHDFNETTVLDYRSWSVWKGYSHVTTRHGPVAGPRTVTRALFHRGMDGDSVATTDNQAMVWEGRRAQVSVPIGTPGQSATVGGSGGRCMEVSWADTAAGTPVRLWDCHGAEWQQWRYTLQPGAYQLTLSSPHSGRCLQPSGTSAGAVLQIADCTSSNLQKWRFTPEGALSNVATGLCADIQNWGVAAGSPIQLYTCTATFNQIWMPRVDGTLLSPQSRRCLDVFNGNNANGTKVQSWTCNGHAAQSWQYQPSGSSMRNVHTNKCLDVAGSGTANGTLVQLYDCNNSPAQIWVPQADGKLLNPNSGKCLDANNPPAHGVQLHLWDCISDAPPQQRWSHLIVDSEALAGQPREQFTLDGNNVLASTVTNYTVTHTGTRPKPIVGGQDLKSYMARATDVKARTWIAATGNWRWTNAITSYDAYGLPTETLDHGDTSTTNDDVCTQTGYSRNTSLHLISLISWERALTHCTQNPADADFLSGSYRYYDNDTTGTVSPIKGLLTKTNVLASVTGGVRTWIQESRTIYDSNGRVTESYDALDRKTTTAYTPASGAPVTSTAVTGPMGTGWTVATDIEPGHGVPTKVIDMNGKATTSQYDPLGRLTKVWRDNRTTAMTPHQQYTYNLSTSQRWIHTQQLGPNGNQISSYQIFDGRLRPRQTQTVTEDGKRTITDTMYDGRGLVAKETSFYNNASGPTSTLVNFADVDADRQTRYVYDGLARPTKKQLFKNNTLQFESTTVYDGDRTGVIPPQGGTVTQDIVDARGRVVEKRQYQSPTSLSGAFVKTIYGYDRRGQLTSVNDPANNTWSYEYDLLGRKFKSIDPDAGTSETRYDVAGQVTSTKDARGQELHYEYDLLGRKIKQRDGSATGPVMAGWTYDTNAKGQLAIATRHAGTGGSDLYKTRITARDDGYRPLHVEVEIPNSTVNGALAGTYAWDYTYKPNGAPATAVLPAAGGLLAETLTHTYDNHGYAQTLTSTWTGGSQTYIANSNYTFDGLVAFRELGGSGRRLHQYHAYDPATRRLTETQLYPENTGSPGNFQPPTIDSYSYDPAGNITSIAGRTDGSVDQTECFRYDHLRRLTTAWTQPALGSGCTTPQKTGADPYWREWTFDTIGNRLTQTDKNPTGGDTTWTYTVGAAGGVKPHQVKQVTASGPLAGTPTRTYSYDNAGNTLTATGPTGAAQNLGWDKEGHLATVTEAGTPTAEYLYDTDGKRLIARTPSKTTLYLPDGTELELASGGGSPLGTRYYNGVAVRDPSGLRWTITNHQNTSVTQIDAITLAATRRRMMPYGEDRGAQPGGWMGTKGYVGGTKDNTGYTHLGAREYDSTLGRFISADPIMDLTNPQQWHAYTYSNNSPVTYSDPDGLRLKEEKSGGVPWSGTGKHLNPKPKKNSWGYGFVKSGRDFLGEMIFYSSGAGLFATVYETGKRWVDESNARNAQGRGLWGAVEDYWNQPWMLGGLYNLVKDLGGLANTAINADSAEVSGGATATLLGSIAALTLGGSRLKLPKASTPTIGSGNAYSVAYEMQLPTTAYPGRSRGHHFQEANRDLAAKMDADPAFGQLMDDMVPGIRDAIVGPRGGISRQSPTTLGWTWHHATDVGKMQLVPTVQHKARGVLQSLFHPGGVGGYSIWG
ncbi:ricin-type beta-trefoil lectin domain protein [Allorhizocola rhizosphaerae]|uniref:ricin-type beta-trefoil lectin domain protein n=1 Tax=Allorhizocola rhizosphaerae TaxID=1872709 RepID=UPI0013C2D90C|nr:ricin-type beta-trefoil lectin domain protein [Allorhizocola rhizosphaerae]